MTNRASVLVLAVMATAASSLASGCESAVVGSECREPLVECGRYCVDLTTDDLNCGSCGNVCPVDCHAGVCVGNDASIVDGGRDGGRDAGPHDAGDDASGGDAGHDAGNDAFVPFDANVDGGGPRCGVGARLCGGACVDPRDGDHCGDCATTCGGTDVCTPAGCAADCGALSACGTRCVDLTSDPHHCGDCTTDCGAGACVASACTTPGDGHLVVIGHDFESRRTAMSTLLANAVFLSTTHSPVRVLGYEGASTAASRTGTNAALAEGAGARPYSLTATSDASVLPSALESADVLLVYAQQNATDDELRTLGYDWGEALDEFLDEGGVVVMLDAPSLTNIGTYQILRTAGLFQATSVSELVTPRLMAVTARASDAVLTGVALPYTGERHTVRISSVDPDAILTTGTASVVFHRVVH